MFFEEYFPWMPVAFQDHSNSWSTICADEYGGYYCTRPPEHDDDHEASVSFTESAARWGVDREALQ